MWEQLEPSERLRLLRFVCCFAWADLEVGPEERDFVAGLVERLGIGAEERREVRQWLRVPPQPDAVDPGSVPLQHRRLFLEAIEGIVAADGSVSPDERESLALFTALLR